MSNSFRLKVLDVAWPEPQRKRSVMEAQSPPPINSINVEIWPLNVLYMEKKLACRQNLVSACFVSILVLMFEPAVICFHGTRSFPHRTFPRRYFPRRFFPARSFPAGLFPARSFLR